MSGHRRAERPLPGPRITSLAARELDVFRRYASAVAGQFSNGPMLVLVVGAAPVVRIRPTPFQLAEGLREKFRRTSGRMPQTLNSGDCWGSLSGEAWCPCGTENASGLHTDREDRAVLCMRGFGDACGGLGGRARRKMPLLWRRECGPAWIVVGKRFRESLRPLPCASMDQLD